MNDSQTVPPFYVYWSATPTRISFSANPFFISGANIMCNYRQPREAQTQWCPTQRDLPLLTCFQSDPLYDLKSMQFKPNVRVSPIFRYLSTLHWTLQQISDAQFREYSIEDPDKVGNKVEAVDKHSLEMLPGYVFHFISVIIEDMYIYVCLVLGCFVQKKNPQ